MTQKLPNIKPENLERPKLTEKDPNNKVPGEPGAKLDSGKSPVFRGLLDYFPRACQAVAKVSQKGAEKYCWKGWENVPDGINRYSDAIVRHMCKEAIEGKIDPDFGLLHKAHAAWNALAVLELELRQQEEFAHTHKEEGILIAELDLNKNINILRNRLENLHIKDTIEPPSGGGGYRYHCNFKDDPNCSPGL